MAAISVRGLTKRFGDVTALSSVDFEVREGEILGLLGPNGAGKTTAVRILVTQARPDSGQAQVAGADVVKNPTEVRRRIGYVPQEITVDRYLTAREQLSLFADLYHIPRQRRPRRIEELLALVGLEAMADKPSRNYSGGMKKKLDLACGLIHEPEVLFLDEPSLGLDVPVRRAIWDHIESLRGRGVTVLLCTNYMDEADRLCDRVAIIDQGKIVAADSPAALRAGLGGGVVTVEPHGGAPAGMRGADGAGPAEGSATAEAPAELLAARLEAILDRLPFVRGTAREGPRLHIYVHTNETALPRVLEVASGAGISLRAVAYSRPGLDEVFLKYTGRAFAEAQAEELVRSSAGQER